MLWQAMVCQVSNPKSLTFASPSITETCFCYSNSETKLYVRPSLKRRVRSKKSWLKWRINTTRTSLFPTSATALSSGVKHSKRPSRLSSSSLATRTSNSGKPRVPMISSGIIGEWIASFNSSAQQSWPLLSLSPHSFFSSSSTLSLASRSTLSIASHLQVSAVNCSMRLTTKKRWKQRQG